MKHSSVQFSKSFDVAIPITFRFCGTGNAFSMVRVDGQEVFLACWDFHETYFDWWQSSSADDKKYYLCEQLMTVGDWITLEPGKAVDMEVMFGEYTGGIMSTMLTVEVEGEEYERNRQGGPILPAFKTEELSRDQIDEIMQFLPENEASLTNGPVFRDYALPEPNVDNEPEARISSTNSTVPLLAGDEENVPRVWNLLDGRSVEAEFLSQIGQRIILKNAKGKMIKMLSSGRIVEISDYIVGRSSFVQYHRGRKYSSYLVVVKDLRGKIITWETPKKWLIENYENLKEIPVGKFIDKSCTRVFPSPPGHFY